MRRKEGEAVGMVLCPFLVHPFELDSLKVENGQHCGQLGQG